MKKLVIGLLLVLLIVSFVSADKGKIDDHTYYVEITSGDDSGDYVICTDSDGNYNKNNKGTLSCGIYTEPVYSDQNLVRACEFSKYDDCVENNLLGFELSPKRIKEYILADDLDENPGKECSDYDTWCSTPSLGYSGTSCEFAEEIIFAVQRTCENSCGNGECLDEDGKHYPAYVEDEAPLIPQCSDGEDNNANGRVDLGGCDVNGNGDLLDEEDVSVVDDSSMDEEVCTGTTSEDGGFFSNIFGLRRTTTPTFGRVVGYVIFGNAGKEVTDEVVKPNKDEWIDGDIACERMGADWDSEESWEVSASEKVECNDGYDNDEDGRVDYDNGNGGWCDVDGDMGITSKNVEQGTIEIGSATESKVYSEITGEWVNEGSISKDDCLNVYGATEEESESGLFSFFTGRAMTRTVTPVAITGPTTNTEDRSDYVMDDDLCPSDCTLELLTNNVCDAECFNMFCYYDSQLCVGESSQEYGVSNCGKFGSCDSNNDCSGGTTCSDGCCSSDGAVQVTAPERDEDRSDYVMDDDLCPEECTLELLTNKFCDAECFSMICYYDGQKCVGEDPADYFDYSCEDNEDCSDFNAKFGYHCVDEMCEAMNQEEWEAEGNVFVAPERSTESKWYDYDPNCGSSNDATEEFELFSFTRDPEAGLTELPDDLADAEPVPMPVLDCFPGSNQSCGTTDIGECEMGIQYCVGGHWDTCIGADVPYEEVCDDGLDNDCDGESDEDCYTEESSGSSDEDNTNVTNNCPTLYMSNISTTEGSLVTLNPTVEDEDGDDVEITFSEPFDENGEWATVSSDVGEYEVTITVNDSVCVIGTTITVTIEEESVSSNDVDTCNFDSDCVDWYGDNYYCSEETCYYEAPEEEYIVYEKEDTTGVECYSDIDCDAGYECFANECDYVEETRDSSNWWVWLLIVFGLLILGGGVAFAYLKYGKKPKTGAKPSSVKQKPVVQSKRTVVKSKPVTNQPKNVIYPQRKPFFGGK